MNHPTSRSRVLRMNSRSQERYRRPNAACILSVVPWPPAIAGAASVLAPTTAEPRKKLRRFSELVIISSQ